MHLVVSIRLSDHLFKSVHTVKATKSCVPVKSALCRAKLCSKVLFLFILFSTKNLEISLLNCKPSFFILVRIFC